MREEIEELLTLMMWVAVFIVLVILAWAAGRVAGLW